jgi:hypothetical protein
VPHPRSLEAKMGQEPTSKPPQDRDEPVNNPARSDAEPQMASSVAQGARANHDAGTKNEDEHNTFATIPDDNSGASIDAPLSSVAAALTGDRDAFLQVLSRAVEADPAPAVRRSLYRASLLASDETAAFERLVAVAIAEAKPITAATICAALAARTVAQSLLEAEGSLGLADREGLLAAWLDAAHAVAAVRGPDGLLRLMPTARKLARRTAGGGEPATEIAITMRRVAARIAADSSIGSAARASPNRREDERMRRGISDSPRRFGISFASRFEPVHRLRHRRRRTSHTVAA